MNLSVEQFERIVEEAIESLPEKFKKKINNLAVFVENFATREQLNKVGLSNPYSLFGLYEGHVQSRRRNVGPVLPDRITIFRQPIIKSCSNGEECVKRIINTVKHEIAHHFGSDEKGARKAGKRA
ncbi:hypothetical protein DRH27_01020 [Candidatus Falkowbacteria bacterium]|nr:MAG: hypothetical protein DRH27_01020 [Candidatus Falkowbacteria bacterium]